MQRQDLWSSEDNARKDNRDVRWGVFLGEAAVIIQTKEGEARQGQGQWGPKTEGM